MTHKLYKCQHANEERIKISQKEPIICLLSNICGPEQDPNSNLTSSVFRGNIF